MRNEQDLRLEILYRESMFLEKIACFLYPTFRSYVMEPHGSLFRAEVNIVPALDGFFEVDIKKSRIVTPLEIKNDILGGGGNLEY